MKYIVLLLVGLGGLAFAILVWPTAWRYDRMDTRSTSSPVRIHRISGEAEILRRDGWAPLRAREVSAPPLQSPVTPEGVAQGPGFLPSQDMLDAMLAPVGYRMAQEEASKRVSVTPSELAAIDLQEASRSEDPSVFHGLIFNANRFTVYDPKCDVILFTRHDKEPRKEPEWIEFEGKQIKRVSFDSASGEWLEALEVKRLGLNVFLDSREEKFVLVPTGWAKLPGRFVVVSMASATKYP